MTYKKNEWQILIRVIALFITLSVAALFLVKGWWIYLVMIVVLIVLQIINFYTFFNKAQDEIAQFVESVHYRDFSRYFNVKQAPAGLQPLREGFNEINSTFKVISREKETQYQYLQKVLELVETGIISLEMETGEVVWMNEALKKLLEIPYLKTLRSLEKRNEILYGELKHLKAGESKVITIVKDQNPLKILLTATAFQTDNRIYKLFAFQNVNEALDETESLAWQKLLSVMTHEIMNSVAPITSLAETLKKRLLQIKTSGKAEEEDNLLEDLELGIETIRRRSEGLLKFSENYRSLNKIAAPQLQKIYVRDLFENLHQLIQPTLSQKNIEMEVILMETALSLEADLNLIEQVLINLLVNGIEAVKDQEQPHIQLSAGTDANGRVFIQVADNGPGIPENMLDKIFIPFFTTKKNGSGIGLSLSKQIMISHHGNIQVQTVRGKGSAFKLQF